MKKNNSTEKKKSDFIDDGRTIADMSNTGGIADLFGMRPRNIRNSVKDNKNENENKENKSDFADLTKGERRAMTKAAWILGLKTAFIGSALLLCIFLLMQIVLYFWNR